MLVKCCFYHHHHHQDHCQCLEWRLCPLNLFFCQSRDGFHFLTLPALEFTTSLTWLFCCKWKTPGILSILEQEELANGFPFEAYFYEHLLSVRSNNLVNYLKEYLSFSISLCTIWVQANFSYIYIYTFKQNFQTPLKFSNVYGFVTLIHSANIFWILTECPDPVWSPGYLAVNQTDMFLPHGIYNPVKTDWVGWHHPIPGKTDWLDGIIDSVDMMTSCPLDWLDGPWTGWMASLTQWAWVWINSGSWCWTGRPGVLQSMRWQRAGHDWATELNWKQTEKTS